MDDDIWFEDEDKRCFCRPGLVHPGQPVQGENSIRGCRQKPGDVLLGFLIFSGIVQIEQDLTDGMDFEKNSGIIVLTAAYKIFPCPLL
jgi:hypothetical protein